MKKSLGQPILHLIGGPNGAGKTTFCKECLPREGSCRRFLNSDEIAKGLSPLDSSASQVQAGRILLQNLSAFIADKETFAIESTLSGTTYAKYLERARHAGFRIELHFLWLPSALESHRRVQQRVKEGGHHVSREDIGRRYPRIIENLFRIYLPMADCWYFWDARKLPLEMVAHSATIPVEDLKNLLRPKP